MSFAVPNLFAAVPRDLPDELFDILAESSCVRVERIVSHGHASPPGFWFDQDRDELVIVLRGAARLRVEGQLGEIELRPGDYLTLLAHQRHRVEWTAPEEPTVWLAVHFGDCP